MEKWADYLISAVEYDEDHKIIRALQHEDKSGEISESQIVGRAVIASNIKNGKSYKTIFSGLRNSWTIGEQINTFSVEGDFCVRIDKNKVKTDHLGQIVELDNPQLENQQLDNPQLE